VRIAHGTLVLALLGTAAFGADIYRSTAPDGTVSYSDRPQNADAQFVSATSSPGQRSTSSAAQTRGEPTSNAGPATAPAIPTLPEGPTAAKLKEERQKNCDIAREVEARFNLSRRLFRTNADTGEREYLDDTATAEARAKAAQDVQDWCD
jgi:hypothetical protein